MEDGIVFLSPKWLLDLVATVFVVPHHIYQESSDDKRIVDATSFIGSAITPSAILEIKTGKISLTTFKVCFFIVYEY